MAELKPYVALVDQRIRRNDSNPLWGLLDDKWLDLIPNLKSLLNDFLNGRPINALEVRSAHLMVRLTEDAGPRKLIISGLAMFLFRCANPHRFKSDVSFNTQLVRRLLGLSDINSGTWFKQETGRTARVYRELPPRAATRIAHWVLPIIGPAGIKLAELEQEERNQRELAAAELRTSMENLK